MLVPWKESYDKPKQHIKNLLIGVLIKDRRREDTERRDSYVKKDQGLEFAVTSQEMPGVTKNWKTQERFAPRTSRRVQTC